MDGQPVEQGQPRFEGALLAAGLGHDFGAVSDLAAAGAAVARSKYYSVGNGGPIAGNAAGADGVAGLQALARQVGIPTP